MRIFISGATGWIGSAVTDELLAHDYEVVGLARSEAGAAALEAKGARAHLGDLDDPQSLVSGAKDADGVIHLAMNHGLRDPAAAGRLEHAAVSALLEELAGTDRTFLLASGLAGLAQGRAATEEDPSPFRGPDALRGGSENLALDSADQGLRPVALRFAATTHGMRDHGFTATLAQVAREKGYVGFVGDGANRWPAVHVSDAARLVRLALEQAPAGFRAHAVAEEGVPMRDIAAALGERFGLPTRSITPEATADHFGWIGRFVGMDAPASATLTRSVLGWSPTGPSLLEDIRSGAYDEA
ncbi:Nucleoside-diphosphate-sugar epimerase [Nocardioides terrae]|uniref:Nucleoside-diphosphate-sugar epimerase n=1 Tax=Nocardioides terrae TaxID=574651 RepID=A0A1I1F132_9ACTN|nr:SDR family oxidoreductase [Nocardioides terrae]SFB90880.1 Nucleoside-diphosphate-sugar epimerase [Nocardioides terrae]